MQFKPLYTTDIRYFERQEIPIPVFDNLSRKYDYDFAHEERSFFSPNNILCVPRVLLPIKIKNNHIIKTFLSILKT